jgi:hypothetical protein
MGDPSGPAFFGCCVVHRPCSGVAGCRQPHHLALLLLLLLLLGCEATSSSLDVFSVAHAGRPVREVEFTTVERLDLERILSLGEPDGPEQRGFGQITDVALSADGSIFVADALNQRVGAFSSDGAFRRWIGRRGSGPGEFLQPFRVVTLGEKLAVYDLRLGRVAVFDTTGTFLSAFPVSSTLVEGLAAAPPDGILLTASLGDSARVYRYDLHGTRTGRYIVAPKADASLTGEGSLPPPGLVCLSPDSLLVYANPWIYEIVALEPNSGRLEWVRRYRSAVVRPLGPAGTHATNRQGASLLGLECGTDRIILAYLDMERQELYYDFLDPDGTSRSRLRFVRSDGEFPGFLADLRGERIVTFRGRPYPQVFVYQIKSARDE